MDKYSKTDKAVLVFLVLLQIVSSSIGKAAGVKMSFSISWIACGFIYLVYLFVKEKKYKNTYSSQQQVIIQSKKSFIPKFSRKFLLILNVVSIAALGICLFELRQTKINEEYYKTVIEKEELNIKTPNDTSATESDLYKRYLKEKGL